MLVEAGHEAQPYNGGDGLYLPSFLADRKGDEAAVYLRFDGTKVKLRDRTSMLDYDYDLNDPESLPQILERVDHIRT